MLNAKIDEIVYENGVAAGIKSEGKVIIIIIKLFIIIINSWKKEFNFKICIY